MKEYCLDDLCPGVELVRIGRWWVKEGDYVKQGVKIADFESTKVNFEVYAPDSGIVSQICVPPGSQISDGTPLILIDHQ